MSLLVRPSSLTSSTLYPTQTDQQNQREVKASIARLSTQRIHNPFLQGLGMIKGQGHQHFWTALQNAGIDPADFKEALQEARDTGARPGSSEFDAIFAEYGIDPNSIPLPQEITRGRPTYNSTMTSEETNLEETVESGNQGSPSMHGRQLNLADSDPTKVLDRVLPDQGMDLEAMQQEAIP